MLNGFKIREMRVKKGYTTMDVSRITHISKSYIEELERGDKKNPSFNKVVSIAMALGIRIDDLVVKF
ncbi:helix-turn-helix domain-containing protein [Clostridium formicaceticum]|uniref:Transcriptional regulator n=1 Tax=Clostridium formicaceticum TaxID=1497 RepID=A0AAC9WI45_9CLOT|nr:helix-turn-helix transcriptional regulator [Clostridium formicaceticum]AOY75167.1 transcriptional regulator [Clostridium formicaceticum]ARE89593.1 anaerobic benzoate catabolism transcriptional regulator [Clostridium formicaceticum]